MNFGEELANNEEVSGGAAARVLSGLILRAHPPSDVIYSKVRFDERKWGEGPFKVFVKKITHFTLTYRRCWALVCKNM